MISFWVLGATDTLWDGFRGPRMCFGSASDLFFRVSKVLIFLSDSFLFNRSKVFIVFSDRLGGNPCKLLLVSFVVRLILLAWTSRMCWHFGFAESRFFLLCCYLSLEGVTVCRLRAGKCTRFTVPSPCFTPELVPNSSCTYKSFTAYIGGRRYVPLHD